MNGTVVAVSRRAAHAPSKDPQPSITLLAGQGVAQDAHAGATVQHRSRVARDPTQANLRQVHLIHTELLTELRQTGFALRPGQMGENITTFGIDLLGLPRGTRLRLGSAAIVEITGLRNPCKQLNEVQPGLMAAVLEHDANGGLIRKAGVMGIVVVGGAVQPGDAITVELPVGALHPLEPV